MKYLRLKQCFAYACLALLVGCSDGGGGEGGTGLDSTNKDIAVGALQSKQGNAITVNGVSFDASNANISIDGVSGISDALDPGMVLTVTGTIDPNGINGTAETITTENVIKGTVQTNNGIDTLVVMEQIIQVPTSAVLVKDKVVIAITGILPDDNIRVSGFVKSSGVISARRVEVSPFAVTQEKVQGLISNLQSAKMTFQIGGLVVDYSTGVTQSTLSDGMLVEVEGVFAPGTKTLAANKVEGHLSGVLNAAKMKMEGFVDAFTSLSDFSVNDILVVVDVGTQYSGGAESDIMLGAELEVEGELIDGILYADKIEFGESIRIEATVATSDLASGTFTLVGFGGLGITYTLQTQTFTEYNNVSLATLPGTTIRMRGQLDRLNSIIFIDRIDERNSSADVYIEGPVTRVAIDEVDILGEAINTSAASNIDFNIGRDAFNAQVQVGSLVKAQGSTDVTSGVLNWISVDIN